jgi:glycosyltransferase involved in cell wall biosynthesis
VSGEVLVGPVDDMDSFWRSCDIGAAPNSTLVESFGLAAAEASAAGLPVVAARLGGVPEVVEDGATGTLTTPGDSAALAEALTTYVNNVSLRRLHGSAGRDRVQRMFSIERNVTDYLDLIESLNVTVDQAQ